VDPGDLKIILCSKILDLRALSDDTSVTYFEQVNGAISMPS